MARKETPYFCIRIDLQRGARSSPQNHSGASPLRIPAWPCPPALRREQCRGTKVLQFVNLPLALQERASFPADLLIATKETHAGHLGLIFGQMVASRHASRYAASLFLPVASPPSFRLLSAKLGAEVMLQLCLWRPPFGTIRMSYAFMHVCLCGPPRRGVLK